MKIIDISQEVLSCNVYPGDPVPTAEKLKSMADGECYNLSALSLCAHNGTHIDAPSHFIRDGKNIDDIALENVVGYCYVAEHNGDVTASDAHTILETARKLGAGDRILIKGDATVTEESAQVFADAKIKLLGNEGQTVGPHDAPMRVHQILLGEQVVLLEGIILENASQGKYFLNSAPLNIAGFEGAPCRAFLIEIQD